MIKRFFAILVAVSLFSLSVFAAEPFAPIYVMGNINFRKGENLWLSRDGYLSADFNSSMGTGSNVVYGDFRYVGSNNTFRNTYSASNVSNITLFLSPLNGTYLLKQDQYYVIRIGFSSRTSSVAFYTSDWSSPYDIIYRSYDSFIFCPREDIVLNNSILSCNLQSPLSSVDSLSLHVNYFSIQALIGFTRGDDVQDVIDSIENQTDAMENQWDKEDQAMAGGVNPSQSGVTDSISQGITDLDDFDNQIFSDFDKYKSDLDFGLSAWGEAAAGISYIGNIFMIIWDNSPNQVIVLSLMLGLCGLVLGRGARLARAARRSDRGADDG